MEETFGETNGNLELDKSNALYYTKILRAIMEKKPETEQNIGASYLQKKEQKFGISRKIGNKRNLKN